MRGQLGAIPLVIELVVYVQWKIFVHTHLPSNGNFVSNDSRLIYCYSHWCRHVLEVQTDFAMATVAVTFTHVP